MNQSECGGKEKNVFKVRVNPERRAFIKTAVLTGGAAVFTGIPLTSYFIAPALNKGTGKWVDFGEVKDLEPNSVALLPYEFLIKDGWLVLPQRGIVWAKTEAGDKLTIFSSICTHLSCTVIWREEDRIFECPCHAGSFDVNGQPVSGPPTKPLAVLEHKIEEGNIKVFLTV